MGPPVVEISRYLEEDSDGDRRLSALDLDVDVACWRTVVRWKNVGKPQENHRKTIGKP